MLKPLNVNDGFRKVARFWCEEVFEVIRVGGPVWKKVFLKVTATKSKSINELTNHWVSWSSSVQTSGGGGGQVWAACPEDAPLQQVLEELERLLGRKKSMWKKFYYTEYRENRTGMVESPRSGADGSAQNPVPWNSVVTELSAQTAVIAIKVHLLILIRWWIFIQSSLLHDLLNHLTLCRNLIWFFPVSFKFLFTVGTVNLASTYQRYDGEDICLYSRMKRVQFTLNPPPPISTVPLSWTRNALQTRDSSGHWSRNQSDLVLELKAFI